MRLIDADEMAVNETEAYVVAQAKIDSPVTLAINSVVHSKIQKLIADTPTVDAVQVVRCKECKSFGVYMFSGNGYCKNQRGIESPKPDDFCSYGERKEGDGNA